MNGVVPLKGKVCLKPIMFCYCFNFVFKLRNGVFPFQKFSVLGPDFKIHHAHSLGADLSLNDVGHELEVFLVKCLGITIAVFFVEKTHGPNGTVRLVFSPFFHF